MPRLGFERFRYVSGRAGARPGAGGQLLPAMKMIFDGRGNIWSR